jgi:hypothetical protein
LTHEGDAIADREQSQQREQELAERIGRAQSTMERRSGPGARLPRTSFNPTSMPKCRMPLSSKEPAVVRDCQIGFA